MIWHYSFNDGIKKNKWCPDRDGKIPKGKTFWYLKLTTFRDFLERRSESSSKPKKHFPTLETYKKIDGKYVLEYSAFERGLFVERYNALKRNGHHGAESMLKDVGHDEKWYRLALLGSDGICWLGDDGKSASLLNLASIIDGRGIGKIMLTELVKYLCDHSYTSFDAGVSGDYGGYKKSIFLDSITG